MRPATVAAHASYGASVGHVIRGFRQDADGEWVVALDCGHERHVRHRPPFEVRPWLADEASRAAHLGTRIECGYCDDDEDLGGERACYAPLACEACGRIGGHETSCPTGR